MYFAYDIHVDGQFCYSRFAKFVDRKQVEQMLADFNAKLQKHSYHNLRQVTEAEWKSKGRNAFDFCYRQ